MSKPKHVLNLHIEPEDLALIDEHRERYGSRANAIRMLIRFASAVLRAQAAPK